MLFLDPFWLTLALQAASRGDEASGPWPVAFFLWALRLLGIC